MMLVKMAQEAGVPDGVVNVIHGQKECKSWLWLETIPCSQSSSPKQCWLAWY